MWHNILTNLLHTVATELFFKIGTALILIFIFTFTFIFSVRPRWQNQPIELPHITFSFCLLLLCHIGLSITSSCSISQWCAKMKRWSFTVVIRWVSSQVLPMLLVSYWRMGWSFRNTLRVNCIWHYWHSSLSLSSLASSDFVLNQCVLCRFDKMYALGVTQYGQMTAGSYCCMLWTFLFKERRVEEWGNHSHQGFDFSRYWSARNRSRHHIDYHERSTQVLRNNGFARQSVCVLRTRRNEWRSSKSGGHCRTCGSYRWSRW